MSKGGEKMVKNMDPCNGYLDGSGKSPFGAHADHNHDDSYTEKNISYIKAFNETVAVSDWNSNKAEIAYEGEFFDIAVADASKEVATAANVSMTSAEAGIIHLECDTTPSAAVKLYVFCRV